MQSIRLLVGTLPIKYLSVEDDVKGFASIITALDQDKEKPLTKEDKEKARTFITFDGVTVANLQEYMVQVYESYKAPEYRKDGRNLQEEPFIPLGMISLPSHGMGITHDNFEKESDAKIGDIVSNALGGKDIGAMIIETIVNYGRYTPKELFEKYFKTVHRDLFLWFINKLFQEDALLYVTEKDEDGKEIQTLEYITVEERNRRLDKRRIAEKKKAELEDKISEESVTIP